jgi:hypothetical protein
VARFQIANLPLKGAEKANEMPFYARSRIVRMGFALATTALSIPAFAQQADTSRDTQSIATQPEAKSQPRLSQSLEDVIDTGSNIRGDVSERAALPLTTISADDIAKQGFHNHFGPTSTNWGVHQDVHDYTACVTEWRSCRRGSHGPHDRLSVHCRFGGWRSFHTPGGRWARRIGA